MVHQLFANPSPPDCSRKPRPFTLAVNRRRVRDGPIEYQPAHEEASASCVTKALSTVAHCHVHKPLQRGQTADTGSRVPRCCRPQVTR